ncbi:MAG: hypothetical protein ACYDAC_10210 [Candidatus Dormibacteria bacterium]
MTAEHVWSRWLGAEVPELGQFGVEVMGVVGQPLPFRQRRRKASGLNPKIVCASGNNGWMSQLQEQAKHHLLPLIRGTDCSLEAPAQELVAAWLSMTVMTASWANPALGDWAIPQEHRTALCETGRPPLSTQLWIASCSHDDRPPGMPIFGMRYRLIRLDHIVGSTVTGIAVPTHPGYGAALSIGNLAAFIFGHTYEPPLRPQITFNGRIGVALRSIWPASVEPVGLPGNIALNYTDFNQLISMLEPWQ